MIKEVKKISQSAYFSCGISNVEQHLPQAGSDLDECPVYKKFLEIKQKCIEKGKKFVDQDFPASRKSISSNSSYRFILKYHFLTKWLRPAEISENPHFLKGDLLTSIHQFRCVCSNANQTDCSYQLSLDMTYYKVF